MIYKGEIPFVRLVIPLMAGILLAYFFPYEGLFSAAIPLSVTNLSMLAFFMFYYKRFVFYRFRWIGGLLLHGLILVVGYWLTVYTSEKYDKEHFSLQKADAFLAKITSEPKISGDISRFEARIVQSYFNEKENSTTGRIIISIQSVSSKSIDHKYGDVLLISSSFNTIDPPYNPGEFDYKSYLANHQTYHQSFLKTDQQYLIDRRQGNPIISFALAFRKRLVDKFYKYIPDKEAAAFASTLILGYRAELSRELIEAYSKTGAMHVLSVSGMHVGIVFLVLSAVLKFMDKTQNTRLTRAFLIISIVWFYALITGFSAPVCRAAVMLSFIVMGKALNKHQNTYNLIAISAFFLLLYNPFYLVDAGFQLSYLAVTGLVYFHPKIYQTIYVKNRPLDYLWSYSALSIAAQLATFPFSIYYFHQFPVYFLLSNLFLVFPVAVIMYAGFLFMFIPSPMILYYTGIILNWLITATNNSLYFIENLPYSSWDGIWVNTFECALICLVILFISYAFRKMMLPIAVCLIILSVSLSLNWAENFNQDRIIFYNLRKKTGIAYISQGRSIIISDIEPSDKLINFSLLPAVKSRGSHKEILYASDDVFSGDSYSIDNNFYQFGSYRILRWNKNFDNITFLKTLIVDAVLLSGNPRITIKQVATCLDFNTIIIDANNPDHKIERWVAEAKELNHSYYILKKNPALIVNL